jgi:hypothetical protein
MFYLPFRTIAIIIIIIIIISDSIFLVITLAASHGKLLNLLRHTVGLLWTSDQPIAKASTYTDNIT